MKLRLHTLVIGTLTRELPLFEVPRGLSIAALNILGDGGKAKAVVALKLPSEILAVD
ncbi:MAG: hypothetical protein WBR15_08685 [Gammaproteobacteria bacterium]